MLYARDLSDLRVCWGLLAHVYSPIYAYRDDLGPMFANGKLRQRFGLICVI